MKKLVVSLFALLSAACTIGAISTISADAAYQKNVLTQSVAMDNGMVNFVDWKEVGKDGSTGTWACEKSDTFISNNTGTGDSMWIEPWASADLQDGNVTLSFDIISTAIADGTPEAYGPRLYALIYPEAGVPAGQQKHSTDNQDFYAQINLTTLCGYHGWFIEGETDVFFKDEGLTQSYGIGSSQCGFQLSEGRLTYTYTKEQTLGVSFTSEAGVNTTVWIKKAFPAAYTSGEMRFGIMDWGCLSIDNLELKQGETVLCSTGFDYGWDTDAATAEKDTCEASGYVSKGDSAYITNITNTGDSMWIEPWASADLQNGNVSLSFDMKKSSAADGSPEAYATRLYALIYPESGVPAGQQKHSTDNQDFYALLKPNTLCGYHGWFIEGERDIFFRDEALTQSYGIGSSEAGFGLGEGRMTIIYTKEQSMCISFTSNAGVTTTVWIKKAFPAAYTSGKMRFGIMDWGCLAIDNLVLKQGDTVLCSTSFDTGWATATATDAKDTCEASGFTQVKSSETINATNTPSTHRMVLKTAIETDEQSAYYFDIKGTIGFTKLNNKFGFAFGLPEQTSETSEGSFVHFYKEADVTYIACGSEKFAVTADLSVDTNLEFYANKGGALKVVIGTQEVTFTGVDFDGYIAMLGEGEGETIARISKKLTVNKYTYRPSEGGEIATNFNTGYVNSDNWVMQNDRALYLEDMSKSNGITFENGKMNYDGTGMWAYFATKQQYGDYIVEFDYTQPANVPATKVNGGVNGNWALCVGAPTQAGALNSYMVSIYYQPDLNTAVMMDFSAGHNVLGGTYFASTSEVYYDAEKDITSAVKIVVANNVITLYTQNITEEEFAASRYVKIGEWSVSNTYGYVCLASGESGFHSFDNLRITPIDDPDTAKVSENVTNFVDRKPIDDEYVVLAAPVISVENNVISWEAVKDAEGYVVTVNGVAKDVQTETSFTVTGVAGDYVITVKAVCNAAWCTNSEASNSVTVTLTATQPDDSGENNSTSDKDSASNNKDSSSDSEGESCFSSVNGYGVVVATLVLAGAVVALRRRKGNEE